MTWVLDSVMQPTAWVEGAPVLPGVQHGNQIIRATEWMMDNGQTVPSDS